MSEQLNKMFSIDFTSDTEGVIETSTIIWNVPNFKNHLENQTTGEIRTKKCEVPNLADATVSKFQLKMIIRADDFIQIYYLSPVPVIIKSVTLYSINNYRYDIVTSEYQVQINRWQSLVRFNYKENIIHKYLHDENRSIYLKFQFMVINCMNVPEAQLTNDLENMLNDGLFSDVTIKSADNIEYKVHKVLLAGRCAVLKAHFEHNTEECLTNVIESPFESEVVHELLTFIYCGHAPRIDEIPESLLAAADYYQIDKLKTLCEDGLYKKLTVENAIETLQLADLHSANTLKQLTLEFIKNSQMELIMKTEGWTKLTSWQIIKKMFEYIIADKM